MCKKMLGILAVLAAAPAAFAAQPEAWRMGFQDPANRLAAQAYDFHTLVTILAALIAVFVMVLLGYAMWRFSAKNHPTPSSLTHNTTLEVLWTVIPAAILVIMAIP